MNQLLNKYDLKKNYSDESHKKFKKELKQIIKDIEMNINIEIMIDFEGKYDESRIDKMRQLLKHLEGYREKHFYCLPVLSELEEEEFKKLLRSISNNIPGLLEEMHIGRAGQKLARKSISTEIDGDFLRVDGPLVSAHMQTFAEKVGFALFYEMTKTIVPPGGGVAARWFSNVEALQGKYPREPLSRATQRSPGRRPRETP